MENLVLKFSATRDSAIESRTPWHDTWMHTGTRLAAATIGGKSQQPPLAAANHSSADKCLLLLKAQQTSFCCQNCQQPTVSAAARTLNWALKSYSLYKQKHTNLELHVILKSFDKMISCNRLLKNFQHTYYFKTAHKFCEIVCTSFDPRTN